jgi:hypothetical protein
MTQQEADRKAIRMLAVIGGGVLIAVIVLALLVLNADGLRSIAGG